MVDQAANLIPFAGFLKRQAIYFRVVHYSIKHTSLLSFQLHGGACGMVQFFSIVIPATLLAGILSGILKYHYLLL